MNIQSLYHRFSATLDELCPMHIHVSASGRVLHVGPTLRKLRPNHPWTGACFLDVFRLVRPRNLTSFDDLLGAVGRKIYIKFQDAPETAMQGLVWPSPSGDGVLLNLSFGISLLEAVRDYALTGSDFAATDMAIEMLFLVEAKSAAMEASQNLNQRLHHARLAAEEQAFTDALTGLRNRRAIEYFLNKYLKAGVPFTYLQLDLDYFKAVNDSFGHAAGDHVLQEVARILEIEARDQDDVARIGGDEFVIIVKGSAPRTRIISMSQCILDRLKEPIVFEGNPCRISTSIGISTVVRGQSISADCIMQQADKALYASKANGRSQYAFFGD